MKPNASYETSVLSVRSAVSEYSLKERQKSGIVMVRSCLPVIFLTLPRMAFQYLRHDLQRVPVVTQADEESHLGVRVILISFEQSYAPVRLFQFRSRGFAYPAPEHMYALLMAHRDQHHSRDDEKNSRHSHNRQRLPEYHHGEKRDPRDRP